MYSHTGPFLQGNFPYSHRQEKKEVPHGYQINTEKFRFKSEREHAKP
jgi:hypothetical protein